MQEVLVYITVGFAFLFLIKELFFKSKKKTSCDKNCSC